MRKRASGVAVTVAIAVLATGCGSGERAEPAERATESTTSAAPARPITTVAPHDAEHSDLRRALAHVRVTPASRTRFEFSSALDHAASPTTDLSRYGYQEVGTAVRRTQRALGFSATKADVAFTAGSGARASGGLFGDWDVQGVAAKLTKLKATTSRTAGDMTRYELPKYTEFADDTPTSQTTKPISLPATLHNIDVGQGLVAYGATSPSAIAAPGRHTLAHLTPFKELAHCLGDVRAAVILPGTQDGPAIAAGTRLTGHTATNVLCARPANGGDPKDMAARIQRNATEFQVPAGNDARALPDTARVQVVKSDSPLVRLLVDDKQINGDALLQAAIGGDVQMLFGS